jgi:hypothetical protein
VISIAFCPLISPLLPIRFNQRADSTPQPDATKLIVNQQHLKQAWDVSQNTNKEHWSEWIRRLALELMKESPSHALRACAALTETHLPLAKELFNAAFVSCWTELFEQYQESSIYYVKNDTLTEGTDTPIGGPCSFDRALPQRAKRAFRCHPHPPQSCRVSRAG